MRCPRCNGPSSEVRETRLTAKGREVRRRRQCLTAKCKERWTTIEAEMIRVVGYVPKGRLRQ